MSEIQGYIVFTFVSSLEYIAAIVFIFSVFRIKFKWYDPRIFFICIAMSYASYTMRIQEQSNILAGVVQLLLMIVLIWLLLQFHIFYAAIMSVTTYLVYGLLQTMIIILFDQLNLIRIEDMKLLSWQSHILASITAIITLLISYWIRKRNWGFSFVPDGDRIKVNYLKKENLLLLVIISTAILLSGFAYYILIISKNVELVFLILILFLLLVSLYFYIMLRKDSREAEAND